MAKFLVWLAAIGNHLQSLLLLLIRLFWGGSFVATGFGKLTHPDVAIDFFQSLGFPFPAFSAMLTGVIELIFGLCLFLGLASRLTAIPLIILMVVAFFAGDMAAIRSAFSDPQNFIHRQPFSFLFASLIVFVFGPGLISLDAFIWKKR